MRFREEEERIRDLEEAERIFRDLKATKEMTEVREKRILLRANMEKRRLQTLYEIAKTINSSLDRETLLQRLIDTVVRLMDAERGMILLYNGVRGDFDAMVARNMENETVADATEYSRGVVRRAQEDEAILCGDALSHPEYGKFESVHRFKIRSLLCVPLRLRDRVIGTIYIDNRTAPNLYDEEDLAFLRSFADLAAIALENARLYQELAAENDDLYQELQRQFAMDQIVGTSDPMRRLVRSLRRVADSDSPALIRGESGAGKELIARAIHFQSPRREKRFVLVSATAIPMSLLESELFGHLRGSFPGALRNKVGLLEMADGGTLYLEELGDLDAALQTKLLRVVEDGEICRLGEAEGRRINVRIISGTARDMGEEVRAGRFRRDLFERLGAITLEVPPLRERREDIPALAGHLLQRASARYHKHVGGVTPQVITLLEGYDYPGNVRELENILEQAILLMGDGGMIGVELLPHRVAGERVSPSIPIEEGKRLDEQVANLERELISRALQRYNWNKSKAARSLGINRWYLYDRMRRFGLPTHD